MKLANALCRLVSEARGAEARVAGPTSDVTAGHVASLEPFSLRLLEIENRLRLWILVGDVCFSPHRGQETAIDRVELRIVLVDQLAEAGTLIRPTGRGADFRR